MGRTNISISERAHAYKAHGIYINDSNSMICRHCNRRVQWSKKDTIEKHLKSANHQKAISEASKSTSLQSSLLASDTSEFIKETVKMCLKANIPLEKLDEPSLRQYLSKYVDGSVDLPCADHLKTVYVPTCAAELKNEVKEMIKNKTIAILVDENTDDRGRCVFSVLFKTVLPSSEQTIVLASCNFLDSANDTSCCRTIVDTLQDYDISYNNIVGFVSDSVSYMTSCYNSLNILIGKDLLHFQCWKHKISLIVNVFMKELKLLYNFITKIEMSFMHSREMKSAYLTFLKLNYPDTSAVLFPNPVTTRWNSWLNSVKYLDMYFDPLIEFFKTTQLKSEDKDKIIKLYKSDPILIKAQTIYMGEICVKFIYLLHQLEGSQYPFAHLLWEEIKDIKRTLNKHINGVFPTALEKLLSFTVGCKKEDIKNCFKNVAEKSLLKLQSHLILNKTNLYYETLSELFNPSVAVLKSSVNVKKIAIFFKNLPLFTSLTESQCIEGYVHFFTQLSSNINCELQLDTLQILISTKVVHEEFGCAAIKSIWCPVSSVNAESFFSKNNLIVSDRRRNLDHSSLETCSMLSLNHF